MWVAMKKIMTYVLAVLLVLCVISPAEAWKGMSEMEAALLSRVNQARISPAATLKQAGDEGKAFVKNHPELEESLEKGMDPLLPDERLFTSASTHAEAMVDESYFSTISKNGNTPEDRILLARYLPLVSDEAMAVILFSNYLDKASAIDRLYENLVENEMGKTASPVLFEPEFKDVGLAIRTGVYDLQGIRLNYYLAVVDLGADSVEPNDRRLFQALNLARNGLKNGDGTPLAPLSFDNTLYQRAQQRLEVLVDELTGVSPDEVRDQDETPETLEIPSVQTSKVWVTVDEKTLEEACDQLLGRLLENELGKEEAERVLLGRDSELSALAMVAKPATFADGNRYFVHAVVIETADLAETPETYELSGVFYVDKNGDGGYTAGEGLTANRITIFQEDKTEAVLFTGSFGDFSCLLSPGNYRLEAQSSNGTMVGHEFTMGKRNLYETVAVETMDDTKTD